MAHVTNKRAEEAAEKPATFRGYPVSCGEYAVIYDDEPDAERLARSLGTNAKHADNKHRDGSWQSFSIVKLPDGWDQVAELEHIS